MTGPVPTNSDVPGDHTSGTFVSGQTGPAAVPPQPGAGRTGDALAGEIVAGEPIDGDPFAQEAVASALVRAADPDLPTAERRNAIAGLAAALRRSGFSGLLKPRAVMAWISDQVVSVAPRLPLRNLATLRAQHPGLSDEQIADRIVKQAATATAAIGAIGGGITSIEWVAPPTLLTAPAVLAAETVAVVAVELKMLGELHELYGQPVAGSAAQRAAGLLQSWAGRRGVSLLVPGRAVTAVLGTAARKELRDRLVRRFGRNLTTLGPLLTGAAVAAYLNRRATKHVAEEVRRDLASQRDVNRAANPA
jgi:hypothetical protein